MAIIECPECKKQISSAATACISCGFPVSPVSPLSAVPIEQTGKKWKKLTLIGAGLVVGGLISMALIGSAGAILLAAGIPVLVYTGFGQWWHHG